MHAVTGHRHKQVLVFNVPEHVLRLGLEVRDHDQALIDWVEHVAVAGRVDANALCTSLVREDLLKRVLALVFQDESLVVDQVIAELAALVNK